MFEQLCGAVPVTRQQQAIEIAQPVLPMAGLGQMDLTKSLYRLFGMALAEQNHRQIVVGVLLRWYQPQHTAVEFRSSIQIPRAVLPQAQFHCLLRRPRDQRLQIRNRPDAGLRHGLGYGDGWRSRRHRLDRILRLAPALKHLHKGVLHLAGEPRFIHQRRCLHLRAQALARLRQCRQVGGQCGQLPDIVLRRRGDPARFAHALQDGAADASHAGAAGQGDKGNAEVQHLEQRGAGVVRKTVEPDVDPAHHVPRRAVAAYAEAPGGYALRCELASQRLRRLGGSEVAAVHHQP